MFDADQIIFEAAAEALSHADLPRRRAILIALKSRLKHNHPALKNVLAQLAMMDGLEKLQSELPLNFRQKPKNDGGK